MHFIRLAHRLQASVAAQYGLIILAAIAAYLPSVQGVFQFDDYGSVIDAPAVQSLSSWYGNLGHGLRPLLKLSYACNWQAGGSLAGFHLVNLLIHVITSLLVFNLARIAIAHRAPDYGMAALMAGLLFAVHPIHSEAVAYICGRSASLMTLWYCAGMITYAGGVRHHHPLCKTFLSCFCFLCAVMTKETAMTFPVAVLLWDVCIAKKPFGMICRRQWPVWGMAILLALGAVAYPATFRLLYTVIGQRPLDQTVLTQIHGVAYLLSRLVLPHRLCIDPDLSIQRISPISLALESFCIIALMIWAVWTFRRRPVVSFGLLWFLSHVFMLPVLLPRIDGVNERHMYLANIGLFMAVSVGARSLYRRLPTLEWRIVTLITGGILLLALTGMTMIRCRDYRSEIALWEQTVQIAPAKARVHNNLGSAYELAGDLPRAFIEYQKALQLNPGYEKAGINIRNLKTLLDRYHHSSKP